MDKTVNSHIISQMANQPTYRQGLEVGLKLCKEFHHWEEEQCEKYENIHWDTNRSTGYRRLYAVLKAEGGVLSKPNKVTATITAENVEQLQLIVNYMSNSGEQADCFVEENIKFDYDYETGDIEISTYKN